MFFPRSFAIFPALTAVFFAGAANAAPLEHHIDGEIALSAITGNGARSYDVYGDFDAGLSWHGISAELGFFGVVGRLHETYAQVGYTNSDNITFAIGAPRPAFDQFATSGLYRAMPRHFLANTAQSRSALTHGTLTQSKFLPVGLSVSGAHDAGQFALTLHDVPNKNVQVLGAGWSQDLGSATADIAVELTSQRKANAKLKYTQHAALADFSVAAYVMEANAAGSAIEVAAGYDASDDLHLFGYYRFELNTQPDSAGVLVEFDLPHDMALDLSAVTHGNDIYLGTMLAHRF